MSDAVQVCEAVLEVLERVSAALFMFSQSSVVHHKTKEDLTRPDIDGGRPRGDLSHLLKTA